jgi:BACON domain-containing protein
VSLNEVEFPPRSGSKVAVDSGGPMTITFRDPVASFSGYFTHSAGITLRAVDAFGSAVGTVTSASDNRSGSGKSPNEQLQLTATGLPIASVTITGSSGGGSFTVDDISVIKPPGPPSTITANPNHVDFMSVTGGPPPAGQPVALESSPTGLYSVQVPVTWVQVNTFGTSTPATLLITPKVAGLAVGSYSTVITVNGSKGQTTSISVTLKILDKPDIFVAPTSLSFSWQQGDPAPAAQSIYVGARSVNVFYFVQPDSDWIVVKPTSGQTGDLSKTLAVSVDVSKLAPGSYKGIISIVSSDASNSPLALPVTLTILPKTGDKL